jgi:hypothetical protein
MLLSADAGQGAGRTVCSGVEAREGETRREARGLGGKLLVDETFCFVFGFEFFFFGSPAAALSTVEGSSCFGLFLANVIAVIDVFCVTRPRSSPETCYAVVGAGRKDVTQWMPVKRPDGVVVCFLYSMGGPYGLRGRVL